MEVEALYRQLGNDASETFYHMLARAFGLKVNAEPFSMFAHALPLKTVLKYRDDALRTEALLFGQAGLLQVDFVDEYPRQLQREHALLAHFHGLRPAPAVSYTHLRAHETVLDLVCRLLLEKNQITYATIKPASHIDYSTSDADTIRTQSV